MDFQATSSSCESNSEDEKSTLYDLIGKSTELMEVLLTSRQDQGEEDLHVDLIMILQEICSSMNSTDAKRLEELADSIAASPMTMKSIHSFLTQCFTGM